MTVQVRLPTLLRAHADGQAAVEVEAGSLAELIAKLGAEFPGIDGQLLTPEGALHRFVNIYLNDDDVRYLEGLDTEVRDGDVVSILPAVAGGATS
jgi:molybdopterin synthase sulfur carrier subunit